MKLNSEELEKITEIMNGRSFVIGYCHDATEEDVTVSVDCANMSLRAQVVVAGIIIDAISFIAQGEKNESIQ